MEPKSEGQPSTSPKGKSVDGDHQKQLQMQPQPQQKIQMTHAQHPQTLSYQKPQTLSYHKPQSFQKFEQKTPDGWYPSQSKLCKQWEEIIERLNAKYNLDCFQNLNLIQNQMKEKSTSMNMVMRYSFNQNNYAIPENL